MNNTKNYRSSNQILCELLEETQNSGQCGIQITSLCQKGNLAHGRLRTFLSKLTSSGLVNQIKFDGKNTFVITEKGILFLKEYTKFTRLAEAFGMEL